MAELLSRDRLQPALLDRLSDDERGATHESREGRLLSLRGLRRAVLRDLGWLLNTTGLAALAPFEGVPLAARSVLNFGLPDLAGKTASGLDRGAVARAIRQAIWDFEPRILRDSLQVAPTASAPALSGPNHLAFEIHGELWGHPLPERLYVRTELDLEIGAVRLFDMDAEAPR